MKRVRQLVDSRSKLSEANNISNGKQFLIGNEKFSLDETMNMLRKLVSTMILCNIFMRRCFLQWISNNKIATDLLEIKLVCSLKTQFEILLNIFNLLGKHGSGVHYDLDSFGTYFSQHARTVQCLQLGCEQWKSSTPFNKHSYLSRAQGTWKNQHTQHSPMPYNTDIIQ